MAAPSSSNSLPQLTSALSDSASKSATHQDEIRLLDLLPGKEDDEIECNIRVVTLGNGEPYEALSYVWGETAGSKIVKVDGHDEKITSNLYAALKRFRNPITKRALWIDQMCIHQWDNEDRARQVNLMRLIYKSCSQCLIWLGEIDEDTAEFATGDAKHVFDFICAAATAKEGPRMNLPVVFTRTAEGERARKAFRSMVMHGNPWWSRIWDSPGSHPAAVGFHATNMCTNILPMFIMVTMMDYEDLVENFLYPVRGLTISQAGEGPLNVLQRWRYREATDPRDKVYALMGLFPHMPFPSVQTCSYDISPATLYARVTIDLIRLEQGLRPLVGFRGEPQVTTNLPTWTLDLKRYDYSCDIKRRPWKWWNHSHRYKRFSASGKKPLEYASLDNEATLSLTGVLVDEIVQVGQVLGEETWVNMTDDQIIATLLSWQALLARYLEVGTVDHGYIGGGSWVDAFWRTMLGDLVMDEFPRGRATESDLDGFQEFLDYRHHNELYVSILDMVVNQAFFITAKGYIGIGPPNIRTTDEVWVLYGGKVPFVLRPKEARTPGVGPSNSFSFVGDAYVNGIMDGEAVKKDTGRKMTVLLH